MKLRNLALMTALTLSGCDHRAIEQQYLKEGSVEVKNRHVEGREGVVLYDGVRFKSGCWHVSVDKDYGREKYEITLRKRLESVLDCDGAPTVAEVDELVNLVEKYSQPDCKIFDLGGKEYRIPRSSAELVHKCYKQETLKKIQGCLTENVPKGWTVKCE